MCSKREGSGLSSNLVTDKEKGGIIMSVLVDFSIFPVDKGGSVSAYVAKALDIIKKSGLPHRLGPMGTSVEGDWGEVMAVVTRCFETLKKESDRVYMTLKVDYRKGASGRLEGKVKSVESKMKG
jgi:uncharacterized protein (TIGR00106 family)